MGPSKAGNKKAEKVQPPLVFLATYRQRQLFLEEGRSRLLVVSLPVVPFSPIPEHRNCCLRLGWLWFRREQLDGQGIQARRGSQCDETKAGFVLDGRSTSSSTKELGYVVVGSSCCCVVPLILPPTPKSHSHAQTSCGRTGFALCC